MKISIKKYYLVLLLIVTAIISSCSVGNKVIPDPAGNIVVDTSGTLGSLTLIVTGDTSFNVTLISDTSSAVGNFIVNDSLQIIGVETNSAILFSTADNVPGTYYTETAPPDITTAVFLFQLKVNGITKRYFMPHGKIIITENNTSTGIVRGSFDVNNEFVASADRTLFLRANFILRYKVK
jgi:hypothetical protein